MGQAERFNLSQTDAQNILDKVTWAVSHWKTVATSPEVGMTNDDLGEFRGAFEGVS
jgi:hypothetical protein